MPTPMAKYKVPHFDAKGEADRRFADLGVPTTFLTDVSLLGQSDIFWNGAEEGTRWETGYRVSNGRQETSRHRG